MKALAVAAALLLATATPARAGGCVISSVTPLSFGAYNVYSGSPIDLQGSVTYLCVAALQLTIDLGTGSSGTFTQRTLTSTSAGGAALGYQLYVDATRAATSVWGDGSNGTKHYGPIIAVLTAVTVPIFARMPAGQDAKVATDYADTIVVTLNY